VQQYDLVQDAGVLVSGQYPPRQFARMRVTCRDALRVVAGAAWYERLVGRVSAKWPWQD